MLRLAERRVVIVGGGSVAVRRARAMLEARAEVHVIAPEFDPALEEMAVTLHPRRYRDGDLAEAYMVVIATDDAAVNEDVAAEADRRCVLANRADRLEAGDVIIPAHGRRGPVTLAVYTQGISAAAGADLRDTLMDAIDPDVLTLLETVAPYRQRCRAEIANARQRQDLLRAMTGERAMEILKQSGVRGLKLHCEALLKA